MDLSRATARPSFWLGLVWTYSGLIWLAIGVACYLQGYPAMVLAAAVRLVVTLWTGIQLCAGDRSGWAAAIALGALHLGFGSLLAALLLGAAATASPFAPGSEVLWWGVDRSQVGTYAPGFAGAALLGLVNCLLLWGQRPGFDVPPGRAFRTLLSAGLPPATAALTADLLLLAGWLAGGR